MLEQDMSMRPSTHRVEVDFPTDAFSHHPWEPQHLAMELRTLWFLEQVRQRRLGFAKASELCGIARARFLDLMREHQITPFDLEVGEIEDELS